MSVYSDIITQVVEWTNKPKLVLEMASAFKNQVRRAHKAGKFYRDLVVVPTGTVAIATVQQIDLSALAPRYRQLATVKSPMIDKPFDVIDVLNLTDFDGYARTNVCYVIGTQLNIRAEIPADSYEITYYQYPDLSDLDTFSDWITTNHEDVLVLGTAASILALVGEQEVKTRVEALYNVALADLISDSVEALGR